MARSKAITGACSVEGCNLSAVCRQFCNPHYQVWYHHGDPLARSIRQPNNGHCAISGCRRPPRSRTAKWCEMHYYRQRRNGNPLMLVLAAPDAPVTQCRQCGGHVRDSRGWYYCSERCYARARRGRVEAVALCLVCGAALPPSTRVDRRYCSGSCRKQAAGKGMNLDLLGKRDGWRCHICGGVVERKDASQDHLIPVSRGGKSDPNNLALAHRGCNARRGAGRLPAQLRLLG